MPDVSCRPLDLASTISRSSPLSLAWPSASRCCSPAIRQGRPRSTLRRTPQNDPPPRGSLASPAPRAASGCRRPSTSVDPALIAASFDADRDPWGAAIVALLEAWEPGVDGTTDPATATAAERRAAAAESVCRRLPATGRGGPRGVGTRPSRARSGRKWIAGSKRGRDERRGPGARGRGAWHPAADVPRHGAC